MALPSAPPAPASAPVAAPGLRRALCLLEEAVLTSGAQRAHGSQPARAVPSAGAVHPYEFAVVAMENGEPAAFRVEADRRTCARLSTGDRVAAALRDCALPLPEAEGALLVTLTRPWLSMRKYGDRGYLYTQLDAGHASANLLLATEGRGGTAELRLRFPRESLAELLGAADNFREIHSAIPLPPGPVDPAWTRWSVHDATGREPHGPAWRPWLESACWDSLTGWTGHHGAPGLPTDPLLPAAAAPLARVRTDGQLPGARAGLGHPSGWPELIGNRTSSKAFTGEAVSATAVWQSVSALSTPLRTDLPDASPLSATLVLRSATESERNAVYRLRTGERRPDRLPSTDEVARACMQQRALAGAAAVLLLHVPRTSLAGLAPAATGETLRELAFRCGALGQLLYLGAHRAGVGVTAIGGFDTRMWRALAGLPQGDEILYALLLGDPDDTGVKFDRLATAHAQNER
ncbi:MULTISPECIES: nitroreductase family protein [unclassified Streptomyces]|uniref:nitroreductase family protein n=1 Tax=unclassified Streptomyces TaxID=2593676 RepID=UPI00278C6BEA|nr:MULTISPECIES: nitroreductase family protein [unclassified Streptomyces]